MYAPTVAVTTSPITKIEDEGLAQQVRQAIESVSPLHKTDRPIQIQVEGQIVTLEGTVASSVVKNQIIQAVGITPGVQQVRDELLVPFDLEFRVVQALANNARTNPIAAKIGVSTVGSTVFLTGRVPSKAVAHLVEIVAGKVRGVRDVCSYLQVAPFEATKNRVTANSESE